MSQFSQFDQLDPPQRPRQERGCLFYGMVGCGIILLISLILVLVGTVLVYKYGRTWAAWAGTEAANAMVDETDLPTEEKTKIKAEIKRLATDFTENKLTMEQVGEIISGTLEGPIGPYVMVRVLEVAYLDRSGLSADEKSLAKRTLHRCVRGVFEKKIDSAQIEGILEALNLQEEKNGKKQLRDKLTDEELRKLVAELKKLADDKQIPDEEYKVDIAGELRRVTEAVKAGRDPHPQIAEPGDANAGEPGEKGGLEVELGEPDAENAPQPGTTTEPAERSESTERVEPSEADEPSPVEPAPVGNLLLPSSELVPTSEAAR